MAPKVEIILNYYCQVLAINHLTHIEYSMFICFMIFYTENWKLKTDIAELRTKNIRLNQRNKELDKLNKELMLKSEKLSRDVSELQNDNGILTQINTDFGDENDELT